MEHLAAILLLLGCSDDAASCTELPAPQVGYETEQACEADMRRALVGAGNSYPLVIAKCIPIDPFSEGDMEIVWDITGEGELIAAVVPYGSDEPAEAVAVARLADGGRSERLR